MLLFLLQAYLWVMAVYVLGSLLVTPFALRKLRAAGYTPAMWLEQGVSYALMGVGLVGVYGFAYAVPVLGPVFWQFFLVVLALFTACQHRMPKTRWLRAQHGPRAVLMASVVGLALLAPMFVAVGQYAFAAPAFWA